MLDRWRVKLRRRTLLQHAKAYFPNCPMMFARDPVTLRTRIGLARRSAAPDRKSSRFRVSGHGLPLWPFRAGFRAEEFRGDAQVVEALVAARPGTCRSCVRAKCKRRPS